MMKTEIRDDRPLKDKVCIIAKGLLKINGFLSKNELHQCIQMLEDPEQVFIGEVESQTKLKVRIKEGQGKKYFQFYITQSPSIKGFTDQVTVTELPSLESAKAFLKGYLAFQKFQG